MRNISAKFDSLRSATTSVTPRMAPEFAERRRERRVMKGDALEMDVLPPGWRTPWGAAPTYTDRSGSKFKKRRCTATPSAVVRATLHTVVSLGTKARL